MKAAESRATVEREVADFFSGHPYLLVSEDRLAVLLCRPFDMVAEAVKAMEDAGRLARRGDDGLLFTDDSEMAAESKA